MPPQHPTPSSYHPPKQHSAVFILIIIVLLVGLIAALGFGFWAFGGMQDYKNNVAQKIQTAVVVAEKKVSTQKDNEFFEKYKSPYDNYQGPDTYGSISFKYPRTWSGYVDASGNGNSALDGYFYPGVVPGTDNGAAYALRVQVLNQSFAQTMSQMSSQGDGTSLKVTPYRAAKVKSVLGSLVVGAINQGQNDTMVVMPLRDKTIEIWTEADQYVKDFNSIIMPSFTFSP